MAFDQPTRNRLARFVSDARAILSAEFTRQLQHEYGMDPVRGDVTPIDRLTALDDARRETARVLRETMAYYLAGQGGADTKVRREVLDRIVREQAFTVLNRLCAFRMAEARGLVLESIGKGYESRGFQLYVRLAGNALGERGDVYRTYLFSMMDEFAVDLPVLFDRFSPQGRLFPREAALLKLLELINDQEIDQLWAEDETVGWIYQYFNSKEERKAMRDASQAPRTSRELAVRNQFFTPRYVVEFLTDNTLGRIWYEMTRGETALKDICRYLVRRPNEIFLNEGEEAPAQEKVEEDLSQEELLKQPVYIPHRPIKDPRELKMLDPACGSMHFGLYAFDLFEQIYAEAWDLEETLGVGTLYRLANLEPLRQTYPDKKAYLRDVPRLIIEHNIHGVDIDPRAVQIAGLSLWLRAQRSWQAQELKLVERPQIRRSNVVCAEPMPGDRSLLEEFLATLREDKLEALMRRTWHVPAGQRVRATRQMADGLAKLVRTVWQEMELAGEAGSLLMVEETLRDAIAAARKESEEKSPLFRVLEYGLNEPGNEQYVQPVAGEDHNFFDRAEGLVLAALREYAEQAENGGGYQRKLFVEDATQGFAFIDLCRKQYDVAVMNPPFGKPSNTSLSYLKKQYPNDWKDIYAAFIVRMRSIVVTGGMVGAITSLLYLYSKQLRELRKSIITQKALSFLVELGAGVLDDAAVETALSIFVNKNVLPTAYKDLLGEPHKNICLLNACQENQFTFHNLNDFVNIFGWPLCLHLNSTLLHLWVGLERLEPSVAEVVAGNHTFDDFRFLRLLSEVDPRKIDSYWQRYEKGGDFQPFLSPPSLLINWNKNGVEARAYQIKIHGTDAQTMQSNSKWYKPGITYPRVSSVGFGPKALSANCIFSEKGMSIFPNAGVDRFALLGVLSSSRIEDLLNAFGRHRSYENSAIANLPFGETLLSKVGEEITRLVKKILSSSLILEMEKEESPYFFTYEWTKEAQQKRLTTQQEIIKACDEIDLILEKSLFSDTTNSVGLISEQKSVLIKKHVFTVKTDRDEVLAQFSVLFGFCFGRWNILIPLNKETLPISIDLFDSIPVCPPGMLQNGHGLPATSKDVPVDYPLHISWSGILPDDEAHHEDVEGRVREALAVVWKEKAEAIEQVVCQILGVKSLREYFRKPSMFFADHLKRYSRSRRAAPIYWPLSTPSCSYTLWLYYHRLNDQTLYTCVNDYVDPKLKQVTDESARLRLKRGRSGAEEKELERLTDFERELKDFRDELLRIAKFWKPNLNDGVEITASQLWKLFQYKPWQKRLKETWEKLEAGEYDWAHLAYNIRPEQVREKCKTDKSLAIAHGLEDLYVELEKLLKKKKGKMKKEAEADSPYDEE